jgi:hypothetical protein
VRGDDDAAEQQEDAADREPAEPASIDKGAGFV